MNHVTRIVLGALAVSLLRIGGGCKNGPPIPDAPAKVANGVKESDLTTLTLTAEAISRLGIETAKAEVRAVARVLKLGGEIVARPGSKAVVAAPAAGIVRAQGPASASCRGGGGARPGGPPAAAPACRQGPHRHRE